MALLVGVVAAAVVVAEVVVVIAVVAALLRLMEKLLVVGVLPVLLVSALAKKPNCEVDFVAPKILPCVVVAKSCCGCCC